MKVRLEPVGEEFEADSGESILDAAFRAGLNLVHGCREGQCSACKCLLLEGSASLRPFSSFALSENEEDRGYTLMCRAVPDEDVVVELLHFDPEAMRLAHPILEGTARVTALEPLTAEIVRLELEAEADFAFTPGQYIDLHVPGHDARRSFSLANLPGERRLELIIKRYPGGLLSGLLGETVRVGTTLAFTGPYGALRLHEGDAPIVMIAGGSGMAPVLGLLRQLAAEGSPRPVRFFFGARTEAELFGAEEIAALGARLADFAFVPVTGRFVHEAVSEFLAGSGMDGSPDVYMCGPPPMIEAAETMLAGHGVNPARCFADRFTTSASAAPAAPELPDPHASATPAPPAADEDRREFLWYEPAGRRRTLYEDVTVDTQPSVHRHLTRGWPLRFEDGRGTWDAASTALRSSDWFAFRDPGGHWERTLYVQGTAVERGLDAAMRLAARDGLLEDMSPDWRAFLRRYGQVPAFVEHGLWYALATAGRACLSDTISTCVCLQAAMKQRSAQALVLHAMDLEPYLGELPIEPAREAWLGDPAWQPARRLLERMAATADWGEVIFAANALFEPAVGVLLRREFLTRAATAGHDVVTPALARASAQEWEWASGWTEAFVAFLIADPLHGEHNRGVLDGWRADWAAECVAAAEAIAALGTGLGVELRPDSPTEPPPLAPPAASPKVQERARVSSTPQAGPPPADDHDWVGIVMAKSAEGDAVAAIVGARPEVQVLEQPAFWDVRARGRLVIPYEEISAALGYEIDAYSIQHEMSTHYGRLVATDDALMLFSDPTEAMEYLLA